MTQKRDLGDFGERIAGHRLEASGMQVVARQVRVPSGEIDLVARDGVETVFVEVRTRRASPGAAAESVTPLKRERMWRCAMEYCEAAAIDPETARLDVVVVEVDGSGRLAHVEHFRGAGAE